MTLPLAFINYLLEDFGDEWVTKYMFHYRWYFEEDANVAGTILPLVDIAVNTPNEMHLRNIRSLYQRGR